MFFLDDLTTKCIICIPSVHQKKKKKLISFFDSHKKVIIIIRLIPSFNYNYVFNYKFFNVFMSPMYKSKN